MLATDRPHAGETGALSVSGEGAAHFSASGVVFGQLDVSEDLFIFLWLIGGALVINFLMTILAAYLVAKLFVTRREVAAYTSGRRDEFRVMGDAQSNEEYVTQVRGQIEARYGKKVADDHLSWFDGDGLTFDP